MTLAALRDRGYHTDRKFGNRFPRGKNFRRVTKETILESLGQKFYYWTLSFPRLPLEKKTQGRGKLPELVWDRRTREHSTASVRGKFFVSSNRMANVRVTGRGRTCEGMLC